jgi:hypothetical protein
MEIDVRKEGGERVGGEKGKEKEVGQKHVSE